MSQFSTLLYNISKNRSPPLFWRFSAFSSTKPAETPNIVKKENAELESIAVNNKKNYSQNENQNSEVSNKGNSNNQKELLVSKINAAKNIEELLNLVKNHEPPRKVAVLILADIVKRMNNKGDIDGNIYKDARFRKLQEVIFPPISDLAATADISRNHGIYSIIKKLEKAEMSIISELSMQQILEVLKTLSMNKKRPTPALRELATYIVKHSAKLNMRECADILYSVSNLRFPDLNLLNHISKNIIFNINKNAKFDMRKIFTSLKSIGLLRYKNDELLDTMCNYLLKNISEVEEIQLHIMIESMGKLNYNINNIMIFLQMYAGILERSGKKDSKWLTFVWTLLLFQKAEKSHIASVLDEKFINGLGEKELTIPRKLQLLNVNGAALYEMKRYNGPLIPNDSELLRAASMMKKENDPYIETLSDTLDAIMTSKDFYDTNVNTDLGFFLDAEYHVDSLGNPIPLEKIKQNGKKIGIMILQYSDYCVEGRNLLGRVELNKRLLQSKGYKLLTIDYRDFSPSDSTEKRREFLKQKMENVKKEIV